MNTILAHFDPEVVLLLQSKFRLKSTKGLGKDVKSDFQDGGCDGYLGFSIGSLLAILCLLGALILLIKFQLNWIIVFRDVQNMNSQHFLSFKCIRPIQMHEEANLTLSYKGQIST